MTDKDTIIATQEAEILRLQQGYMELKSWCIKLLDDGNYNDYTKGYDAALSDIVDQIDCITGASND